MSKTKVQGKYARNTPIKKVSYLFIFTNKKG